MPKQTALADNSHTKSNAALKEKRSSTSGRSSPPRKKYEIHPELPLERQEFFHGFLTREDINALLKEDGDFVVRITERGDEPEYVLSVQWNGKCCHCIFKHDEVNDTWSLGHEWYKSIPELIDVYVSQQRPVKSKAPIYLLHPKLPEQWELNHEDIVKDVKIGQGNFGTVHKGTLSIDTPDCTANVTEVAIKESHGEISKEEKQSILSEARIMRHFQHENIVRFYGIAAKKTPLTIVLEYCSNGSLRDYLIKNASSKKTETITITKRLEFVVDAAKGMEYLHSKLCIHRDLAARNCLLSSKQTVKIADFGLSHVGRNQSKQKSEMIPWRWAAPEALKAKKFNRKSDIWSFGVLMWEIYTDGEIPYSWFDCATLIDYLQSGKRLDVPKGMSFGVSGVMNDCFKGDPSQRPEFTRIGKLLSECLVEFDKGKEPNRTE